MENTKFAGYIRSPTANQNACDVQRHMIEAYCAAQGIDDCTVYEDKGFRENRHKSGVAVANILGLCAERWSDEYPACEQLMLDVMTGNITTILVDTKLRLYAGTEQKRVFERVLNGSQTNIIEVGSITPSQKDDDLQTVCVYHYAIKPGRTTVVLNQIDRMYDYAVTKIDGSAVVGLYLDHSDRARKMLDRLLLRNDIDVILSKDLYHIKRYLGAFIHILFHLVANNTQLITLEEGKISTTMDTPVITNVTIYENPQSEFEIENQSILIDRLKLFCKQKNWQVKRVVVNDGDANPIDLLSRENDTDMILVSSYSRLISETSELGRLISKVTTPIYSIKEGRILFCDKESLIL